MNYYRRVDEIVGEFVELLPEDASLFMLSNHGSCTIEQEVYLNHFLERAGFLSFKTDQPMTIRDVDPSRSRVYCMDPGRLYVNLKGREPEGIVVQGSLEQVISEVSDLIRGIRDPQTDRQAVKDIHRSSALFSGPCLAEAPDLIAQPWDGYDLKGMMGKPAGFAKGHLTGMHTFDDAFSFCITDHDQEPITSIRQFANAIMSVFD
ncbi:MAG: alkaline phosphatase family protein [Thermoleophilia bacterium]